MADEQSSDDDARDEKAQSPHVVNYRSAEVKTSRRGGFFTIYKKGQGYWTRMGTALGAALISFLCAEFVYTQMRTIPIGRLASGQPRYIPLQFCIAAFCLVLGSMLFFAWRMMNKPSNADFLIATDSEMKKVNWTTRKELIGSTKVVIFFVILISLILFSLDVIFGYFFQMIKVLEFGPFQ